jgi:sugar/nucleoside kinase (ribokinase family)
VGIVTASGPETSLEPLRDIPVISIESPQSTTFENIYTEHGRIQYVRAFATRIDFNWVPEIWRSTPIIHLAPIADEVDSVLPEGFSPRIVGLTPQGWMREWDSEGRVFARPWASVEAALPRAGAVVISREDVNRDDELIENWANQTRMLAVTEAASGSVLYWHGDRRRFRASPVAEVDATGAGDVYAATLFSRLLRTNDPWESARFASLLASYTVTRVGLDGVPTAEEIRACMTEVLQ